MKDAQSVSSATVFDENPYMKDGSGVKSRRKYSGRSKGIQHVTDDGEILSLEVTQTKFVDDATFVKVFRDGMAAMYNLTPAGTKMLARLMEEIQKEPNKDKAYLHYTDKENGFKRSTFYSGIANLLTNDFISKSATPNCYYINHWMVWNGDRFKFSREYIRQQQSKKDHK